MAALENEPPRPRRQPQPKINWSVNVWTLIVVVFAAGGLFFKIHNNGKEVARAHQRITATNGNITKVKNKLSDDLSDELGDLKDELADLAGAVRAAEEGRSQAQRATDSNIERLYGTVRDLQVRILGGGGR